MSTQIRRAWLIVMAILVGTLAFGAAPVSQATAAVPPGDTSRDVGSADDLCKRGKGKNNRASKRKKNRRTKQAMRRARRDNDAGDRKSTTRPSTPRADSKTS